MCCTRSGFPCGYVDTGWLQRQKIAPGAGKVSSPLSWFCVLSGWRPCFASVSYCGLSSLNRYLSLAALVGWSSCSFLSVLQSCVSALHILYLVQACAPDRPAVCLRILTNPPTRFLYFCWLFLPSLSPRHWTWTASTSCTCSATARRSRGAARTGPTGASTVSMFFLPGNVVAGRTFLFVWGGGSLWWRLWPRLGLCRIVATLEQDWVGKLPVLTASYGIRVCLPRCVLETKALVP